MKWLDDKTRRREQIFRALLVLGLFIFYGPLIWGDIPSGADITLMFGPFYSAGWDGGPPLWARYHLGGAGLYNNLQSEILYPLRWPFFFVDWRSYFGLFNFLHYAAALFGMAVFARALRFGRTASLLAAFAFAMGGQMVARLMNPTILYAYSWLPWLLYGALSRRRRRRWITTASMAMICLLGSPHGILYGLVGFSMVFLITREWRNPKDVAKTAARDIAHLALAAVLAAPTLIAGLRRAGQSLRSRADVSLNLADSMTFGEIPLSLLGGSGGANYPEYNDLTSFVGAIVLALVIASAAFPRSWRDRRFFVGLSLSLSGLIFALGENIGLQTIMPHVPVFSKLAGPMRGMVLTALGAPLLAAIGLERLREAGKTRWIAFGLAVPVAVILLVSAFRFFRESYFPGAGSGAVWPWWRAWIERPDCVFPPLFFFINAAVGLLLFALTGLLTLRSRRTFAIVIVGLVFCDLLHFAPRVRPPTLAREVFDPPENIRFLQERMREEGPFRVAGYEPLRRGDADFFEAQKFERLMPNLAGIYGLEQIQGFDPLVPLRQVETFEQCGLRSPLDDPVRGLQFTYPDPGLFRLMGVRYLVGDPHMRRLTSIPQVLEPRQPVQSVDLEPGKMTGWLAATSYAAPAPLRPGMAVCVLEVTTSDGEIHRYPVRSAIETHHVAMPQSSLPLFQQWTTPIPLAPGRYGRLNNVYRTWIDFGETLDVQSIRWRLAADGLLVQIWSQAFCLPETNTNWTRVWGGTGDLVVYRFENTLPMAQVLDEANNSPLPDVAVDYQNRGANGLRLRVSGLEEPAVLVLREWWNPTWKAKVNGRQVEVSETQEGLCKLELPAGDCDVRLYIRPNFFIGLSILSALIVTIALARLLLWARKKRP